VRDNRGDQWSEEPYQTESAVYALDMRSGSLIIFVRNACKNACQSGCKYCVFQRSWAFLTLALAVSLVKGGARDMLVAANERVRIDGREEGKVKRSGKAVRSI